MKSATRYFRIAFGLLILALATVAVIWKVKKLPEPMIVAIAAVIGLLIYQSPKL